MLTLLALYPVVFLFGYFVQNPILIGAVGVAILPGPVRRQPRRRGDPQLGGAVGQWSLRLVDAAGRQRDAAAHSARYRHRGRAVRVAPAHLLAVSARVLVVLVTSTGKCVGLLGPLTQIESSAPPICRARQKNAATNLAFRGSNPYSVSATSAQHVRRPDCRDSSSRPHADGGPHRLGGPAVPLRLWLVILSFAVVARDDPLDARADVFCRSPGGAPRWDLWQPGRGRRSPGESGHHQR